MKEKSVFLDRSALEAFMNPSTPLHRKAASFFYGLDDFQQPMITLNLMIYELHEWVRAQAGYEQAHFFFNAIKKAEQVNLLTIIQVDESIEQEAVRLMLEHPEYEYSFLEACTLIVINDLGIDRIFSLDPHWARITRDWPNLQVVPT